MKKVFTKFTFLILGMLLFNFSSFGQDLQCIISLPSGDIMVPVGAPVDAFGGVMATGESVSGVLAAVVSDVTADPPATDTPEMGCDTIVNGADVIGHMALIQRGACNFSDKVYRAQNVGAIGAIICNHTEGAGVIGMSSGGDFGGQAVIPSGFISFEDCALITAAMDNGDEVSVTLRKPNLFSGASAFAKQTPISQIKSLDSIEVSYANTRDSVLTETVFTVDITAPNGDLTTLTSGGDIAAMQNVVAGFDSYLPSEMGRYEVVFSNSVTVDSIFDFFEISEHTWALDDNSFATQAALTEDGFNGSNFRYDLASHYLTGEAGAIVTHVSFALANAADLATGNPDNDIFTLFVYQTDPDGDNEINVAENAADVNYDLFELVGFSSVIIDGTEEQNQLLVAQINNLTTDIAETPLALVENSQYLIVASYNGAGAATGTSPAFTTGGNTPYPYFGTMVFSDRLFLGGFTGNPAGVVRLYEEGEFEFIVGTENLYLDKSQVQLSPNPVTTELTVSFDLNEQADRVKVDIINIQGGVIQTQVLENVLNGAYQINVDGIAAGSYVLMTSTPEGRSATQFVITK